MSVPASAVYPMVVRGHLDSQLGRWRWLVKWLLAVPHLLALVFLWLAFAVLTVVAGISIAFTGRYPRGIFDFVMGMHRWTWRVVAYAALMRDEYPPFRFDQGGIDPGSTPRPGAPASGDDAVRTAA